MQLLVAGVNHTTANVELRERIAFPAEQLEAALKDLCGQPAVCQAAILSTCNRTELYCLVDQPNFPVVNWLSDWHGLYAETLREAVYVRREEDALRHMMRVASGLDSLVLGEPQVLGQMREAYALALGVGALRSDLGRYFQTVFSAAKRIRTETEIGANPVSVAYAAVSFARHIFTDLHKSNALLIGAGEMVELVARHLRDQRVNRITVANRTLARAQVLAEEVSGQAISLESVPRELPDTDIVISCTASPLPILGKGVVERALKKRRHKPIFMVDIAVPRDIEPEVGELEDVYLYTVDDLHEAIEENVRQRQDAARAAEDIIETILVRFREEMKEQGAVDTLRAYREQVQALARQELEKSLRQLENGVEAADVLSRFERSLVNKILHVPSVQMRKLARENRLEALRLAREVLLDSDGKQLSSPQEPPEN